MKNCAKCKKDKSLIYFHKHNTYPDGLFPLCKLCRKTQDRKYYLKSSKKERLLARHKSVRQEINELKSKTKCRVCKEDDPACLDFHHLRDKKIVIARSIGHGRNVLMKEITKCIILCANCHRKLHNKRFSLLK